MTIQSAFRRGVTIRRDMAPLPRYETPVQAEFRASTEKSTELEDLRTFITELYEASDKAFSVTEEFGSNKDKILCTLNDNPHIQFYVEAMHDHIHMQMDGTEPMVRSIHKGGDAQDQAMQDFACWVGRTCLGIDEQMKIKLHAMRQTEATPILDNEGSNVIQATFGQPT